MRGKGLLFAVMSVLPVVLLGAIAYVARTRTIPDDGPRFGPELHDRLLAYAPLVAMVEGLAASGSHSLEATLRASAAWVGAHDGGALSPVTRPEFDAPANEGALFQIREAQDRLIGLCARWAERTVAAGRASESAHLWLEAVAVAEVNKYADLATVRLLSIRQTAALRRLARLAPALSAAERSAALRRLATLSDSRRGIENTIGHLRRLHIRALAADGQTAQSIELWRGYRLLAELARDPSVATALASRRITAECGVAPNIVSSTTGLRMALLADAEYREALAAARRALKAHSVSK